MSSTKPSVKSVNLQKTVLAIFDEFFTIVAQKFDLRYSDVKKACTGPPVGPPHGSPHGPPRGPPVGKDIPKKKSMSLFEEAKSFISQETPEGKLTVDKLKEMCRAKGLKVSGKKEELLQRLENPNVAENKGKGGGGGKKKKSLFKSRDVSKIVEKLQGAVSSLAVRKNAQGHYIHINTGLVFDPITQRVIGCWKNEQVKWLTKEDVENCIELGVPYELPENLDLGIVKVVDKKVEEMLGEDDFKEEESEVDESDDDAELD